jgi:hypothetical protein
MLIEGRRHKQIKMKWNSRTFPSNSQGRFTFVPRRTQEAQQQDNEEIDEESTRIALTTVVRVTETITGILGSENGNSLGTTGSRSLHRKIKS